MCDWCCSFLTLDGSPRIGQPFSHDAYAQPPEPISVTDVTDVIDVIDVAAINEWQWQRKERHAYVSFHARHGRTCTCRLTFYLSVSEMCSIPPFPVHRTLWTAKYFLLLKKKSRIFPVSCDNAHCFIQLCLGGRYVNGSFLLFRGLLQRDTNFPRVTTTNSARLPDNNTPVDGLIIIVAM